MEIETLKNLEISRSFLKNSFCVFRSATKYNILHCNYKIPPEVTQNSKSLISALLQLNVENRLGGYEADFKLVKSHEYFQEIDWNFVESKNLKPPFVPSLKGAFDVSHFDEKHTKDFKDSGVNFKMFIKFQSCFIYIFVFFSGVIIEATFNNYTTESIDVLPYIESFDYTFPALQ